MHLINPQEELSKIDGLVEAKNYLLKIRLVKLLYQKGAFTASEICTNMGISLPTVNSLLMDLIQSGEIIKQGRAASQGGRKPDLYRLAPDAFFVVAVDLSKYGASIALYNCQHLMVKEKVVYPLLLNNEVQTFDQFCEYLENYISTSGYPQQKIIAIGISMPGLIDSKAGINHTYLNFDEKSLQKHLEDRFPQAIFLENDARAMTLAEYKFGAAKSAHHVLGIFVGWGIGLGMVIDGNIYQGISGFAGEFAHSPLFESNDINCTCGKKGCLEAVASGTSMVRMAKEAVQMDPDSILARMVKLNEGKIDPKLVVLAAIEGDQKAITLLADVGLNLGRGISILIQLLNPELIVLGGVVADADQYILTPIQQALNIHSMAKSREKTKITTYQLGHEVGLIGAIAVTTEKIFTEVLSRPN